MTLEQAIINARKYASGSRFHADAMAVLFKAYRAGHPTAQFVSLNELWTWIKATQERATLSSFYHKGENDDN